MARFYVAPLDYFNLGPTDRYAAPSYSSVYGCIVIADNVLRLQERIAEYWLRDTLPCDRTLAVMRKDTNISSGHHWELLWTFERTD